MGLPTLTPGDQRDWSRAALWPQSMTYKRSTAPDLGSRGADGEPDGRRRDQRPANAPMRPRRSHGMAPSLATSYSHHVATRPGAARDGRNPDSPPAARRATPFALEARVTLQHVDARADGGEDADDRRRVRKCRPRTRSPPGPLSRIDQSGSGSPNRRSRLVDVDGRIRNAPRVTSPAPSQINGDGVSPSSAHARRMDAMGPISQSTPICEGR